MKINLTVKMQLSNYFWKNNIPEHQHKGELAHLLSHLEKSFGFILVVVDNPIRNVWFNLDDHFRLNKKITDKVIKETMAEKLFFPRSLPVNWFKPHQQRWVYSFTKILMLSDSKYGEGLPQELVQIDGNVCLEGETPFSVKFDEWVPWEDLKEGKE